MTLSINKVAVLGAGVMGASIAAHIVGAGVPVCLLDIVPNALTDEEKSKGLSTDSYEFRNRFSIAGKSKVTNPKFKAIYDTDLGAMIEVGNLTDNLGMLKDCDWIIEVILENVEVKQKLMENISEYLKSDAIITSNTSGVSINEIVKNMPLSIKQRFLGTHFFNPPRYMNLFEIIPARDTIPEIIDFMADFATEKLGKGVVFARDTPNFIANRIGCHANIAVAKLTEEYGFSIPKADLLTGEIIGRPRSATFKTMDIVGIDILVHVADNVINNKIGEKAKDEYLVPEYVMDMVHNKCLGDKTNGGFYKKIKSEIGIKRLYWDYNEKEYVEITPESIDCVEFAKRGKTLSDKLIKLIYGDSKESEFAWRVIKANLLYSANCIPEITSNYIEIDNAMKWGFNWELGPFEIWDAIGVKESIEKMKQEGEVIPDWVEKRMSEGRAKFYETENMKVPYIRLSAPEFSVIDENNGATLKDIGDQIVCLEFKTKGNTITDDVISMIYNAVEVVEKGDYKGLVIANQAKNFSVGANLALIREYAKEKAWTKIEKMVQEFQYANMSLKYCNKPVVTAAYGMTLGGGAEIALHGYRQVANAETYMGLVELGVGLVPGGGGCKELLWRGMEGLSKVSMAERVNHVKNIWSAIASAKVSSSAHEAKKLGFIRGTDQINMNLKYQVKEAKDVALFLSNLSFRKNIKKDLVVTGKTGRGAIRIGIDMMKDGKMITEYDTFLADKVAFILTGGDVLPGTAVSEEYILGLEKEAFLSLCGETKTLERIEYMLAKGKPLRN
ncbi:3-hydroxyacyl-CoA dehydrogenase/enoyl-CoA hydratase family protein [Acetobacterium malicum]|uniref:3-hydroxyacyl-CoA dehydrogenase/enoyl-CoA hydratase family protein n=1 Tax=Acetobacterium malicum TaxID=52692 RepID=UPI0004190C77|nr:3-hydroxyacyl-CoA dehydrogenase/enoyl-CoA hydratase family protein [Acetobacterium dehalogenans]